ncbi:MAG: hypothetical protein Q8O67_07505 [Deltaproteobacteria bacterium]|nr:hypothetical protein [Deltaproteobacteria bacterium]
MTRERAHKGSGRTRKKTSTKKALNDRLQEPGTDVQVVKQEEEREGEALLGVEPRPAAPPER